MSTAKLGRVLVVDDEVNLKTVLVETLSEHGYEVVGYTSGHEALAALQEQNFDVLLSDLMMPEMDGITLLRAGLDLDPDLIGIIMTGQGTVQTAVDAMKLGAFDYVLKPFKLRTFLPTLARAIQMRHLRLENLQLQETVAMYELSQTLAFTLDPQTVLSKLADAALQQSKADEVSILLPTPDGSEFYVAAVRGEARDTLLGERVPFEQGIASWVVREHMPLILDGKVNDERLAPLVPRADIRSTIVMPLLAAGKLVGILTLNAGHNRRPFALGQVKALSILANTAAVALQGASLHEQVREAEEKYRSIFQNAVEGICQTTPDGRFLTANPALAHILGYESPQELIATITDMQRQLYVEPTQRAEFIRLLREQTTMVGVEAEVYRKDGSKIWITLSARAVHDASGTLLCYEGSIEDITERKQAEEALYKAHDELEMRVRERTTELVAANEVLRTEISERERAQEALLRSEEHFRLLIENIADVITVLESDGTVRYQSPSLEQRLGYRLQESVGKNVFELLHPDDVPRVREAFSHVLHNAGSAFSTECRFQHRDGSWRVFEVAGTNLLDHPAVGGVVVNAHDITERKEVERLKDELISVVSHELRTPLTSLRGFAQLMLQRDFTPEKRREFLTILHNEAIRLTNLINDFLDIQRIESRRQVYHFDHVELLPLIRETVTLFTQEDEKHTVRLQVPDSLPPVQADADRIRQVLSNLLSNALKFSPHGGEVTVGACQEGAYIKVWVADCGVGIPPEALPKLFSKFFRVDNQETRHISGTGLGLALVKEIVEAHQGRVGVESAPGQGSTFSFTLPAAELAEPPLPVRKAGAESTVDVVLVENDPAYAQLLREHCEGAGLSVTTTAYAEQALELVRHLPPHLVLTDIHLGGRMDGWDLLVELKSDPTLRPIPVLIISVSEETNTRGLALAGADYLLKPVAPQWLRQAVQQRLPSLSSGRVLVVDDDAVFRHYVTKCLAAVGDIQVDEAANGREALARMEQHWPDVLLLDLLTPEVDGFEMLLRLRADKRAMNLPVLVVTGKDLTPDEKVYIRHRLAEIVSKRGVSPASLAQLIEQTLGAQHNG